MEEEYKEIEEEEIDEEEIKEEEIKEEEIKEEEEEIREEEIDEEEIYEEEIDKEKKEEEGIRGEEEIKGEKTIKINEEEIKEIKSNIIDDFIESETVQKSILNIEKYEFIGNLSGIINSIDIGKCYEYIGEDYNVIIKPTNASYLESSTHVNFTKCENILRKVLNISSSRIITFCQIEIDNKNDKSLVNKVEYQVYDDKKNILDLSLCNDSNIQIFHAIKDNSLIDINSISSFKDIGVDILNINDSFFNDICQPYSDSNNDVTLEDRIKDIYQNYSLCEDGCVYNELNTEYMTVSCDCKVKSNVSINDTSLNIENLDNVKIESNFALVKCYSLVFSFKGKLKNIGFWLLSFLLIGNIIFLVLYFAKGIKQIKDFLIKDMINNGYINSNYINKNLNSKKSFNHKIKKYKIKNHENNPPKKNKNISNNSKTNQKEKNNIIHKSKKTHINNNIKITDSSSRVNFKSSNKEIINQINDNNSKYKNNNNKEIKFEKKSSIKKINTKIIKKLVKKGTKNISKKNNNLMVDNSYNLNKNAETQNDGSENNNNGILNEKINEKNKNNNIINFSLININLNNKEKYNPKKSLNILNNYTFDEAIKYDMRSILAIFYIFLLSKEPICHAFLYKSPVESFPLRFCLLIFIISSDFALNAIFYLDDKISEKYKYAKNLFLFTFNSNITIILLSTLIGFFFMTLFTNLSNLTNNIKEVFRKEEEKLKKNKNYIVTEKRKKEILEEVEKILKKHKIKVIILISIEMAFMLFFWYYITAFCHVYSSTQTSWLLDSVLSMLSRLIIILLF